MDGGMDVTRILQVAAVEAGRLSPGLGVCSFWKRLANHEGADKMR